MNEQDLLPSRKDRAPSVNKENTKSLGIIVAFIVLSLAIIAGSAFYYLAYEKKFHARSEDQLSAIAELKVNELVEWRKERLADAAIFYRNGDFAASVKRYFKNPEDSDAHNRLQTWLGKLAENSQYDFVFLLDTACKERMFLPDKREPAASHLAKDVAGVFHSGNITFLDFHHDSPDGPIHLALLIPIFDNNRPLSVLVLRIDPNTYLYPYIQKWPVPSKTSETLIARREGNAAVFLNELKFQKNTALTLKIPLDKTKTPAVEAVLGRQGTMEGIDYRGVPVFAATRTVPNSPWFLVARTDIVEVFAPLRERLWQMILLICIILASIGGCLFLLLKQQRMRYYREQFKAAENLRESEEKFRNEFNNSAIGKSFTSLDGSVDVNPAFCEMLGYTKEELARQKWQDFTHPDDNELTKKLLKELLSGEKSKIRCRKRYIKKDGSIVWADVSTVLQKDKEGKPVYYITEVIDITDRKKAEEALQESERKLSEAQKMAQLGHWDWDIKTGKVVWSDEVYKIFRIDPENFTPHIDSILELSPWPEDHERDKELIRKAMESHEKGSYEQRFLRPDKSIGYYDSTFRGKYDNHGNLVSIVGTVQDITERKRVDEALKKNEERFRIIAESITDVIYEWDLKDSIQWFGNVDALLGYPAGAFSRTLDGWVSALHPEDKENVLAAIERQLKGAVPYNVEYRIKGKDDVLYWWSARGSVITDERGEKIKWLGAVTDITERKQAEETLRMNEARFRTLVENIPQKIFMKDRKVRWISINEKLAHDFGFRPEDVVGKMNADLFPPELAAKYQADDIRIMESGKTEELEEKYIREGRETWVNTIKTPVKNATGEIVGMLGVFWDITERKHMEIKLHEYTEQLEQKRRDLEQIIYVTSHDLRSPLVNVQGFAKELSKSIMDLMESIHTGDISAEVMRRMEPILKNDIPESLEYIQSSIARMDMQLSALLKLSRLGRAAINIEKLDMDKLVDEVVKSLEYMAKEKGAQITVAKLPPCVADAAQTNQVFLNLIGNALKYLDAKRPGIIQVRGNTQENRVIYCVEDNGVGVPPECQDKIFEIFYRVEQNKCPGEGLGLTIVRQSAEKQNGAVWVESEAGKGSKFFIKLPGI